MNKIEQGVLRQSRFSHLLAHMLLLLTFFFSQNIFSEPAPADEQQLEHSRKNHVFIIFSPDNPLYKKIASNLSDELILERPEFVIAKTGSDKKINSTDNRTDIIVAIGIEAIRIADKNHPDSAKLFISTAPNKFRLGTKENKNDAILYMSQSYCRQIRFIKLLDNNWKTISVLNNRKKPVAGKTIQQCANKNGINAYIVNIDNKENLTDKIKHALNHSDVLLALPDRNIYNSKTVKNILLTSYRYRKPVIGFSRNFVNAGALGAIHSEPQQIAKSAKQLVDIFFDSGMKFTKQINYPEAFEIDINTQVFRALDLSIPDINKLKLAIEQQESNSPGEQK